MGREQESLSPDALLAEGLALMHEREFAKAVVALRRAVESRDAPGLWRACLAQALFMTGDFAACVSEFEVAARQQALPSNALAALAQARCLRDLCGAEASAVDTAILCYASEADADSEALLVFAEQAMSILSGFGHTAAAARIGRWRLGRAAGNAVLRYRQAVLEGVGFARAPADYVEKHFDDFADRFDHQLVDLLGYAAPTELAGMVARYRPSFSSAVDLGCGTGLAAAALRPMSDRLVGVDLSERMLAKCWERSGYDALVKDDVVAFLVEGGRGFDLIFAADVLIYLGDLAAFFDAVAATLPQDGVLAITTERADEGWKLLDSGRFAHADSYLDALAAGRLTLVARKELLLRKEGGAHVLGAAHVYRRSD